MSKEELLATIGSELLRAIDHDALLGDRLPDRVMLAVEKARLRAAGAL